MVARGCGEEGMRSYCLMGAEFRRCKSSGEDGGDGGTKM